MAADETTEAGEQPVKPVRAKKAKTEAAAAEPKAPKAPKAPKEKKAKEAIPVELLGRSKRYRESYKTFKEDVVDVATGVTQLKTFKGTKFDQTIEVIFSLGIDAKHADQMIRTSISVPHGIGKSKRVVAIVSENLVQAALDAGAIKAGSQNLVEEIEKTNFTDFDVAIATPDMMRFVGRLGKVLGPKGLMPSPKAGTVTTDVANVVKEFAAGKMEIRNDSGGNVHTVVGKFSFENNKLVDNINSMISSIKKLKPAAAKGVYIKKIVLKGSMTPAVYLKAE
jgi:large subunit ribosomal protein L1